MASMTETMIQSIAVVQPLPTANYAANAVANAAGLVTGAIDMNIVRRARGTVIVGATVGASCTVTATFLASNSSNTLCTGLWTAITNGPTVAPTANMCGQIEIRADQLPSGKRYLMMLCNPNCASFFGGILEGDVSAYKPAKDNVPTANSTYVVQNTCNI
jgi:hypothetical protein